MKRNIAFGILALAVIGLLLAVSVPAPQGGSGRIDPYKNFKFKVEIDGIEVPDLLRVSGLKCTVEVIEWRSASEPNLVRLLPGATRCGPLTLERGFTGDSYFYDWYAAVRDGSDERRSGSVIAFDQAGQEVCRWKFYQAFPVKWEGPALDASKNELAIETLEIAVERIDLVK